MEVRPEGIKKSCSAKYYRTGLFKVLNKSLVSFLEPSKTKTTQTKINKDSKKC